MKKLFLPMLVLISSSAIGQTFEKKVAHFDQVLVSPKINLVLMQGDNESVKINYPNVDESKINVVVKHNKLHIYLDHSKYLEKRKRVNRDGYTNKESIYKEASITAYVTYTQLKRLGVRGNQEVDVQGKIAGKKFKLSAYGENEITFSHVQVDKLKIALYGQHSLKIMEGSAGLQKFKLFGENKVDTQALQSDEVASATYGESKLKLNARDNIRVVTFGESNVSVKGQADIDQFSLGEVSIRKQE
jgi:ribosomal protein L21